MSYCMDARINPVIQGVFIRADEQIKLSRNSHKFRITALYDWNKGIKEEHFDKTRIFCAEYRIGFSIRAFDTTLEDDREHVIKLPAFHIHYDFDYEKTIYLEDEPKDAILEVIEKYTPKNNWGFTWGFHIPRFYTGRRVVPVLASTV